MLLFWLTARTLRQRPHRCALVWGVLAVLSDRRAPLRLLDLGTGTGCLLLALLSELPAAEGCGIDISAAAVEQATANAAGPGLAARTRFLRHSWTDGLDRLGGTWDGIVSNPPYIASAEIAGLAPAVRSEEHTSEPQSQ